VVSKELLYAVLSGENKELAFSELIAILDAERLNYELLEILDHVVIFRSNSKALWTISRRAGLVREAGRVVALCEASMDEVIKTLKSIEWGELLIGKTPLVDVTFFKEYGLGLNGDELLTQLSKLLGGCKYLRGSKVGEFIDVLVTEGIALIGLGSFRRRVSSWSYREPSKRPIYKPGTMKPKLARVFVNLARVKSFSNELLLDPFCGVGGFLIEACDMGLKYVGSDINIDYVVGAKINLRHYGCEPNVLQADALRLYLVKDSIDGIATDPPYGRMTSTYRKYLADLYEGFIYESAEVLKRGKYLVFAIPYDEKLKELTEDSLIGAGFKVVGRHFNWVHSSLTRLIYEAILQ